MQSLDTPLPAAISLAARHSLFPAGNSPAERRRLIGGSDARIIMGSDEKALRTLWLQKRGEIDPPDFSRNLPVQLGLATEDLNRNWFRLQTGLAIDHVQARIFDGARPFIAATLDGLIVKTGDVFEAKFMLPWGFSEEAAAAKHMAQLQHNMAVAKAGAASLSIITGGGSWVHIVADASPIYQAAMLDAELEFWDCVKSGREPRLVNAPPPLPRAEIVRIADMTQNEDWSRLAGIFKATKAPHDAHLAAKDGLKSLMPADAKEAIGSAIKAKRSKSGAVSFDLI